MIAPARTGDAVLLRLPGAAWRALPWLAACGAGITLAVVVALWITAWTPVLAPPVGALLASPFLAWAVDAVHRQLFDEQTAVSHRRRLLAAAIGCVAPAALAAWSTIVAGLADTSMAWPLQVLAVAAVVAAAVCAAVGVVAVPLAAIRADAALRSVAALSFIAVVRRPLGALAALACTAAVVWLGLSWFAGLLVLAGPVLVVLMVGAAWTTVVSAGVDLPALAVLRPRTRTSPGEEE
ncbi:hypothetical protein [Microbacterium sp. NPDC057741]|uniref:hypothetical protein n=1 Tax=Microbacterium sp. NPDC057741 TaxID=3346235 RepID=UPI00366DF0D8